MAKWLSEHPQMFVSSYKEPHYFNFDDRRVVNTLEYYESLFDGADDRHLAVGEASVWYLSSAVAVKNVLDYSPDAKFIAMFRNPVEMAPALHAELCYTGDETELDFEKAWDLQETRSSGKHVPASSWVPRRLQYGEACSLGTQLERLLQQVSNERVLTIFIDDLKVDPKAEYRRVLAFLGVPDDGRSEFPVHNAAKVRRWPVVARLASAIVRLKQFFGITGGLGLWRKVDSVNRVDGPRAPISGQMRDRLKSYFQDDIAKLQALSGKNLQQWLS